MDVAVNLRAAGELANEQFWAELNRCGDINESLIVQTKLGTNLRQRLTEALHEANKKSLPAAWVEPQNIAAALSKKLEAKVLSTKLETRTSRKRQSDKTTAVVGPWLCRVIWGLFGVRLDESPKGLFLRYPGAKDVTNVECIKTSIKDSLKPKPPLPSSCLLDLLMNVAVKLEKDRKLGNGNYWAHLNALASCEGTNPFNRDSIDQAALPNELLSELRLEFESQLPAPPPPEPPRRKRSHSPTASDQLSKRSVQETHTMQPPPVMSTEQHVTVHSSESPLASSSISSETRAMLVAHLNASKRGPPNPETRIAKNLINQATLPNELLSDLKSQCDKTSTAVYRPEQHVTVRSSESPLASPSSISSPVASPEQRAVHSSSVAPHQAQSDPSSISQTTDDSPLLPCLASPVRREEGITADDLQPMGAPPPQRGDTPRHQVQSDPQHLSSESLGTLPSSMIHRTDSTMTESASETQKIQPVPVAPGSTDDQFLPCQPQSDRHAPPPDISTEQHVTAHSSESLRTVRQPMGASYDLLLSSCSVPVRPTSITADNLQNVADKL